ncbi:MAG: ABC transporter ATP-binding protein [Bacteroidia bacterium]|nr:ABC transporter ATP-binding protein [Bacteroidia bacterium]MDG1746888.1 ABC transporter ATP-binding protein [Bacteroidia bacterium]
MISCRNISKEFSQVSVLKNISLEVKAKEIVCITGESGAGKSTLLHIAGTLLSPSSGELTIAGEDATQLKGNKLSAFRNKHLGFVFQFHQLIAELSAVENAMLPMLIAGLKRSTAEKEAKERLAYLGLEHRFSHKPGQLSGGEQQRVSIARALAMKPSVILADEPSGNLDSKNAKHIHELFLKMRDDFDLTFLIVTHNLELAQLADRRVELADGRINDLNT